MIVKDQLQRQLRLKNPPKRIVSLVPSLTELIVELGLEDSLVGVTKFCIHPKHLRKTKTIVGGTKQVHIEKIENLNPDIILCNKEENTEEIVQVLSDIAQIHISDINNFEDCFELIDMYGELFEVQKSSRKLIDSIRTERQSFQKYLENMSTKKVAYFIWKKPWMVAGSKTFIHSMLSEAGFQNAFEGVERYPEISLDEKVLEDTDVIFLSSEPYPFKEKHVQELTSVFPNKQIQIVDGELFSWYGSRLLKAFDYFKSLY